jgi:hypothetical protein
MGRLRSSPAAPLTDWSSSKSRTTSTAATTSATSTADDSNTTTEDPQRFVQYALVCLVAMVGYADRINMSVAVLGMADEMGWTLQDRAASMAAFFYGCVRTACTYRTLRSSFRWSSIRAFLLLGDVWRVVA